MTGVVVMGVAGAGKSAVGEALAARLNRPFLEGDDLHPAANRAKMASGHPLTDADREPWLDAVGTWLREHPGGIASCSALRRAYRDRLRAHVPGLRFVHLAGDPEIARARMAARAGHFMPVALSESQLATLQPLAPDERGVTLDYDTPLTELVDRLAVELEPDLRPPPGRDAPA